MHHDPRCMSPHGATCTCAPSATAHTVPVAGRIPRTREDRTVPVLPSATDWTLTADALAALAWCDGAELAAHVGDRDLAVIYNHSLCACDLCVARGAA